MGLDLVHICEVLIGSLGALIIFCFVLGLVATLCVKETADLAMALVARLYPEETED